MTDRRGERVAPARWSTTVICPRQATLAATLNGGADRDITDTEARYFWRGWTVGRDYADALAASLGCEFCKAVVAKGQRTPNHIECPIIREKPVTWPAGTLHTDIYITATDTPVEILSSANPAGDQIDRKLLQLAGQIHFDNDAGDFGVLVIVNPTDYTEEKIRFRLDDEWRDRVEHAAGAVAASLATNGRALPDRVCKHPADAPSRFCRYVDTCFQGWEAPTIADLELNPDAAAALEMLERIKTNRADAKRRDKTLEADQRHLESQLAHSIPVGEWIIDGQRVTRARRSRESFGKRQAHDAGIPDHVIRAHTTISEWDEWKISDVFE